MKTYDKLYKNLLNEYQNLNNTNQNPAFLKLKQYFQSVGENKNDEEINQILNALKQEEETSENKKEEDVVETPKQNSTTPTQNTSPITYNPLNPFNNRNQQKPV